jgi:hypothetical protein
MGDTSTYEGAGGTITTSETTGRLPLLATTEPRILKLQKSRRPCALLLKAPPKKQDINFDAIATEVNVR